MAFPIKFGIADFQQFVLDNANEDFFRFLFENKNIGELCDDFRILFEGELTVEQWSISLVGLFMLQTSQPALIEDIIKNQLIKNLIHSLDTITPDMLLESCQIIVCALGYRGPYPSHNIIDFYNALPSDHISTYKLRLCLGTTILINFVSYGAGLWESKLVKLSVYLDHLDLIDQSALLNRSNTCHLVTVLNSLLVVVDAVIRNSAPLKAAGYEEYIKYSRPDLTRLIIWYMHFYDEVAKRRCLSGYQMNYNIMLSKHLLEMITKLQNALQKMDQKIIEKALAIKK